ncbi:MAG: NAD(P)(+) transhydrogenase (Re/Si-specific) subunit alpha, partial [Chitinophagaceae bacterium]|nr:NAD(P)(+) transhydrogenase (Re/Si-specific) subunit alpha [Chitinophagaceae bacterium]
MVIGVLKEPSFETRVSLLPDATATLTKKGITVIVEDGAGEKAFSNNDDYTKSGAKIGSASAILQTADIILSIHPPSNVPANKIVIGVYQPLYNYDQVSKWAKEGVT